MENPAFKNQTQLLTFATLNLMKITEIDIIKNNTEMYKRIKKNNKMLTTVLEDYIQICTLLKHPHLIRTLSPTKRVSVSRKKITIKKQKTVTTDSSDENDSDTSSSSSSSSSSDDSSSSDEDKNETRKRVSVNRDIADYLIDGQRVKNVYHGLERIGTYCSAKNMIMYNGKTYTLSSFVANHRKDCTQFKYYPVNAWKVCKCEISNGKWIPILKNN